MYKENVKMKSSWCDKSAMLKVSPKKESYRDHCSIVLETNINWSHGHGLYFVHFINYSSKNA